MGVHLEEDAFVGDNVKEAERWSWETSDASAPPSDLHKLTLHTLLPDGGLEQATIL